MGTIAFFAFLFFSGLLQWLVIDGIWEDAGIQDPTLGIDPPLDAEKSSPPQAACAQPRNLVIK